MNYVQRYLRNLEIVRQYNEGVSMKALGEKYELSFTALRKVLDQSLEAGIPVKEQARNKRAGNPELYRKIAEEYTNGVKGRELAAQYSLSTQRIYQILNEQGVSKRQRKQIAHAVVDILSADTVVTDSILEVTVS